MESSSRREPALSSTPLSQGPIAPKRHFNYPQARSGVSALAISDPTELRLGRARRLTKARDDSHNLGLHKGAYCCPSES